MANQPTRVEIPISVGELIDKLSILQNKRTHLSDEDDIANVDAAIAELEAVYDTIYHSHELSYLWGQLRAINEQLWDIEDDIRACDYAGEFDSEFIYLARSVYRVNDHRWRIKAEIDKLTGSTIQDVKQYTTYGV
jgi:hypothetical protein